MPTFTFTSPEGKSYSVQGPEGSTSEQAYGVLQQQLKAGTAQGSEGQAPRATPSGASGDASAEPPAERQTLAGAMKSIGKSAVGGAVAGALSPEIVTGLGMAATAIPVVGEAVGPALIATGRALRGARLAEAATGAVSGAGGELAEQAALAKGMEKSHAEMVGLGVALLTPSVTAVGKFVTGPVKTLWSAVQHLAGAGEASTPKAVESAREKLAALADAGKPQLALHAALEEGVAADQRAAEAAANAHVAEAHARAAEMARTDEAGAARLVEDARVRGAQLRGEAAQRAEVLSKATDNKLATAKRVYALTQPELSKVGTPKELSDIGGELKTNVLQVQKAESESRAAAYQQTVKERDAVVAAKEAAGQTLDKTAGMKELKQELSTKLLNTAAGRTAAKGLAQVTEPGVKGAYQRVYDSVINKRVQTGFDESGAPQYQTFKTSFEALDHVRRKLGDVIAGGGKDAEGYSAIGSGIARDLYQKISKIQEDFAGKEVQRKLQSEYAKASGNLERFDSKTGRKLADMDPKDVPKQFFTSKQGVQEARALVGSDEMVNRAASDYAARSLDGLSGRQAAKWAKDNGEWVKEVPGLREKVAAFTGKVSQIERVGGKLEERAAASKQAAVAVKSEGQKLAEREYEEAVKRAGKASEGSVAVQQRVREAGEKGAEALRQEKLAASSKLDAILKGGEAPEAARSLLLNGKPEQTRLAARTLAGVPGGQRVLEDSVRQTLRNMSEKNLRQSWSERVLPMLREGQMIPQDRLAALQKDVERVLDAHAGKAGLTRVQRYVAAAIGAVGGAAAAELTKGLGSN